jgi:hypothetical protein
MTKWVSDCCGAETTHQDIIDAMRCNQCGSLCRIVSDFKKKPSIEVKEWDEIRIKGQPDAGFPPYDFTFYSYREYEVGGDYLSAFEKIKKHLPKWTDVVISKRHVRQEITEWEPITKDELSDGNK